MVTANSNKSFLQELKLISRNSMREVVIQKLNYLTKDREHIKVKSVPGGTGFHNKNDVAELIFGSGSIVLVTTLENIRRTDIVHNGILAMDRLRKEPGKYQAMLMIVPKFIIDRHVNLNKKVLISTMELNHIDAAISTILTNCEH